MLIGIAGPKGSGKDTIATIIQEELYGTEHANILSFARPLKKFICDIFNMDCRHSNGHLKEVGVTGLIPSREHIVAAGVEHLKIPPSDAAYLGGCIISFLTATEASGPNTFFSSYRRLMQCIGTDIIREIFDQDFWITVLDSTIVHKHTDVNGGATIIPDVRFENEAKYVRERGIIVHLVGRAEVDNPEHITENGVAVEYNDIIYNNLHTLEDTRKNIPTFMMMHLNQRSAELGEGHLV